MAFWSFNRKSKADELQARIDDLESQLRAQGHPVNVIEDAGTLSHHYDKERNAARIAQLETAIAQFRESGLPDHPQVAHLQSELTKHLKIKRAFHPDEEV